MGGERKFRIEKENSSVVVVLNRLVTSTSTSATLPVHAIFARTLLDLFVHVIESFIGSRLELGDSSLAYERDGNVTVTELDEDNSLVGVIVKIMSSIEFTTFGLNVIEQAAKAAAKS